MTIRRTLCSLLVFLATTPELVRGQCSDAGICSIAMPVGPSKAFVFSVTGEYGRSSDDRLSFADVSIGLAAELYQGVSIKGQFPFRRISGPRGTVAGIGDLLCVLSAPITSGQGFEARIEAGVRIAIGAVNRGGLPQAYQPGLGTNDLLLGASIRRDRWSGGVAYQMSEGRSPNLVDELRRGSDLSARVGYAILDDETSVSMEIMMIQKLDRASARPTAMPLPTFDQYVDIPDSDKLQVNLLASGAWSIGNDLTMTVQAALALLDRPVNLDGLKRNFSLSAGIAIPFE